MSADKCLMGCRRQRSASDGSDRKTEKSTFGDLLFLPVVKGRISAPKTHRGTHATRTLFPPFVFSYWCGLKNEFFIDSDPIYTMRVKSSKFSFAPNFSQFLREFCTKKKKKLAKKVSGKGGTTPSWNDSVTGALQSSLWKNKTKNQKEFFTS